MMREPTDPGAEGESCRTIDDLPSGSKDGERYRVFIEDVADGFYETDLKGHFTFFNDALCRILGRSRSDIRAHDFRQFMDADNARLAYQSFNELYRTGGARLDIHWEILRPSGEQRILEVSARLIRDAEGRRIGFRGIARDVTESHLAHQTLEASRRQARAQYHASRRAERRYRAFLEFLPDPVFVFNLDNTVSYLNPAFEKTFGWTLAEMEGKQIPFVPEDLREQTREGIRRLKAEKIIHGFETRRLTRDGRALDIVIDGAMFYDDNGQPAGQVITLRDVTSEKRSLRSNQAFFRISKAVHRYRALDELLNFITRETRELIGLEGAMVILLDEEKQEFYFREAVFDAPETGSRIKEVRYPADKGVAGHVYRTGEPLIVPDYSKSPYSLQTVDQKSGLHTRSMLDVPIRHKDRFIGVLCAVNKKDATFDRTDLEMLSTIAGMVALPIENARVNEALQRTLDEVRSLNRAKDRVIHHLSHELKTPVAVLSASLKMMGRKLDALPDPRNGKILQRAQRNLERLLEMQYEIEDILQEGESRSHRMLSTLLDACSDVLEVAVSEAVGEGALVAHLRRRIDELFGPREVRARKICLDRFVSAKIASLSRRHRHRECRLLTDLQPVDVICIPSEVLNKIVEGLVRNAVENTPDEGRIEVRVTAGPEGPELEVADFGVGITDENQKLIFESNFSTRESLQYTSRRRYDFNAGGRGFDLLRMKIFSERFGFWIRMQSRRCRYIPRDEDLCPGVVSRCPHCHSLQECLESGGTVVTVGFRAAPEITDDETRLEEPDPDKPELTLEY